MTVTTGGQLRKEIRAASPEIKDYFSTSWLRSQCIEKSTYTGRKDRLISNKKTENVYLKTIQLNYVSVDMDMLSQKKNH